MVRLIEVKLDLFYSEIEQEKIPPIFVRSSIMKITYNGNYFIFIEQVALHIL